MSKSYLEAFNIICAIESSSKNIQFRIKRTTKFTRLIEKLQEYLDCKVYTIYICSSKQLITNYNQQIYDVISHDVVTNTIVDDAIIVSTCETSEVNVEALHEMRDDLLQKDIINYMVSNMIQRIILNNEPLNIAFDITRKKRKYRSAIDITYTWKQNPYVVFHSKKKARLFLMHGSKY